MEKKSPQDDENSPINIGLKAAATKNTGITELTCDCTPRVDALAVTTLQQWKRCVVFVKLDTDGSTGVYQKLGAKQ